MKGEMVLKEQIQIMLIIYTRAFEIAPAELAVLMWKMAWSAQATEPSMKNYDVTHDTSIAYHFTK